VYDPVFSEEDLALFTKLKIQVLEENKNGVHPISVPTICFLPHCDLQLYESFFRANWTLEQLSNLVLVANKLTEYSDNTSSQNLRKTAPCLQRLAPILECQELPVLTGWPTAFNNITVQYLSSQIESTDVWFLGQT